MTLYDPLIGGGWLPSSALSNDLNRFVAGDEGALEFGFHCRPFVFIREAGLKPTFPAILDSVEWKLFRPSSSPIAH
jgi:hypothetical protein